MQLCKKKVRHIPCSRYRAIMYPLRRTPSKLMSKVIIVIIWLVGFAFALPMGLMHSFGYVVEKDAPFDQVASLMMRLFKDKLEDVDL